MLHILSIAVLPDQSLSQQLHLNRPDLLLLLTPDQIEPRTSNEYDLLVLMLVLKLLQISLLLHNDTFILTANDPKIALYH